MGLETGTYISDLNINNPISGDLKSAGDNHLRLIKQVLKNTFPNATKPMSFPTAYGIAATTAIPANYNGSTVLGVTSGGDITLVLPALVVADAGWECDFIKYGFDYNVMWIQPASGALRSGDIPASFARTRRCVPGGRSKAFWTGSEWLVTRTMGVPIGTVLDWAAPVGGATAPPPGYLWPNGQAVSGVTYPEYVATVHGGGALPDLRGFVMAGRDDMGGANALRLNPVYGIINGAVIWTNAGSQIHTLTADQQANMGVSGSTGGADRSLDHTHGYTDNFTVGGYGGGGPFASGGPYGPGSAPGTTGGASGGTLDHLHGVSGTAFGGGNWHPNLQPTFIFNKIVVME